MTNTPKKQGTGKVCIIRHGHFPRDRRVIKEVQALCEAGYSVDVICLKAPGEKRREVVDSANVYRLNKRFRRGPMWRYALEYGWSLASFTVMVSVLYFRRFYDCVQVNTLPDFLVFSALVPRLFGAKIVLDMHEPTPEMYQTISGADYSPMLFRLIVFLERISIKFAHRVYAVNDTIRERYIERGSPRHKIHVVRNVPLEGFSRMLPSPPAVKNGFQLLTHGAILKRYGHEVLIRALPLLRKHITGLHLFIVGEGEDENRLKVLCDTLDVSEMVTFTGRVPFEDVGGFIQAADVGVVPLLDTPFSELCQPNKLFEYVASKRPVVCSRLAAIEESFDDTALMLFEAGNSNDLARCVLELYHNPAKGREIALQAYRRYDELRWRKTKHDYLRVFESLLNP